MVGFFATLVEPEHLTFPCVNDTTHFAHALLSMEGVGRVTAGRLLRHFATYDTLLRYPREQVLTRLKGLPNAADLVARLLDREGMAPVLTAAAQAVRTLREKGIHVFSAGAPGWPEALEALPRSLRPVLLYGFGSTQVFARSRVALLARPPFSDAAFDRAQDLVRTLTLQGVSLVTGVASGFDTVVHKVAGDAPAPALLVAHSGLARIPTPMRAVATRVVRRGGLLLSSFPMDRGPYEHDDRERALVQAALCGACVFLEPRPDTPEMQALEWALEAGRSVFGIAAPQHALPDRVHRLEGAVDFEWVLAAAHPPP